MTEKTNFIGIPLYHQEKDESYMSKKMREHFINILVTWKKALLEDAQETVKSLQESTNFADPIDRAADEEERSVSLKTSDRKRKLLKKIESTIDKINEGDFGFCDSCGIEIGVRRLEARPTANECIDCKSFDEIKEKTDIA